MGPFLMVRRCKFKLFLQNRTGCKIGCRLAKGQWFRGFELCLQLSCLLQVN